MLVLNLSQTQQKRKDIVKEWIIDAKEKSEKMIRELGVGISTFKELMDSIIIVHINKLRDEGVRSFIIRPTRVIFSNNGIEIELIDCPIVAYLDLANSKPHEEFKGLGDEDFMIDALTYRNGRWVAVYISKKAALHGEIEENLEVEIVP